jgi:hypothetical protein
MGRIVAWVGILVGCYTGSTPATPPADPHPDAHRWREAVADAALAALAAGDVDGVVALVEPATIAREPIECGTGLRAALTPAIDLLRGKQVGGLDLTLARTDRTIATGDTFAGRCVARVPLAVHHVTARGRRGRVRVELDVGETGGRYYLVSTPTVDSSSSAFMLRRLRDYEGRMCACTDRTCANKVQDDMTQEFTRRIRETRARDKPDPDAVRESGQIMTRYTQCMTKLMIPATP